MRPYSSATDRGLTERTLGGESIHYGIVCAKTMFFVTTVEAGIEGAFEVPVVRNHNVFIATVITYREAASVISVQFSSVSFPKVKIFV